VEALAERRMDVACVQDIQWRGSGCRFFGAIGKRYKLFWMGSKAKTDGVGIFVAEKWVDSVVSVERHGERALVLKMVLGDCLLNVFTVYAPHSGKPDEEKERLWNEVFSLVSCIPQYQMVVFAGDMNGHIGSSNVGYDGTHGGFGYGSRNADGSRILEFADGLTLVICNTLFTKQEAKLVTYVAGPDKKTWWWNEEVAEAVREKKIKYGKWKRENTKEARMEYKKSRQNAKRVISSAKEKKQNTHTHNRLTVLSGTTR